MRINKPIMIMLVFLCSLHLCEYNNGKVLHDFILPDDCEQLCGVLQRTLFYDVDSSDCSYKVFNIR